MNRGWRAGSGSWSPKLVPTEAETDMIGVEMQNITRGKTCNVLWNVAVGDAVRSAKG